MENVKKQTEKIWIFLGLAAGVLVMSAGIWGLFFMLSLIHTDAADE